MGHERTSSLSLHSRACTAPSAKLTLIFSRKSPRAKTRRYRTNAVFEGRAPLHTLCNLWAAGGGEGGGLSCIPFATFLGQGKGGLFAVYSWQPYVGEVGEGGGVKNRVIPDCVLLLSERATSSYTTLTCSMSKSASSM